LESTSTGGHSVQSAGSDYYGWHTGHRETCAICNPQPACPKDLVCPNCGHCPSCGRTRPSGYWYPYSNPPFWPPYITWGTNTAGTSDTGNYNASGQ